MPEWIGADVPDRDLENEVSSGSSIHGGRRGRWTTPGNPHDEAAHRSRPTRWHHLPPPGAPELPSARSPGGPLDHGIDDEFIKEVMESGTPGKSVALLLARKMTPDRVGRRRQNTGKSRTTATCQISGRWRQEPSLARQTPRESRWGSARRGGTLGEWDLDRRGRSVSPQSIATVRDLQTGRPRQPERRAETLDRGRDPEIWPRQAGGC